MSQDATPPRRVVVTAHRTWVSPAVIHAALAEAWGDGRAVLVTSTHPSGAQRLAELWWRSRGGVVQREPQGWRLHRPTSPGHCPDVSVSFTRDGAQLSDHQPALAAAIGRARHAVDELADTHPDRAHRQHHTHTQDQDENQDADERGNR